MSDTIANVTYSQNGKLYARMKKEEVRTQIDMQEFKTDKKREKAYNKQIKIFDYADGLVDRVNDGIISEEEILAYDKKENTKKCVQIGFAALAFTALSVCTTLFLKRGVTGIFIKNMKKAKQMAKINKIQKPDGYEDAVNYVKHISNEHWTDLSKKLFVQSGETKSEFLANFDKIGMYLNDVKNNATKETIEAYTMIRSRAEIFADRMNRAISLGKNPLNTAHYNEKFMITNKKYFDTLQKFFESQNINQNFNILEMGNNAKLYQDKICALSNGVLHEGQTFYHGTKDAKSIIKNGFSLFPKKLQGEHSSRELGQAIYLSPNRQVAASFAGYTGDVIHADVNLKKVAAINLSQQKILSDELSHLCEGSPIKTELVAKELFQRNGYNAAYSRSALGSAANLVDKFTGGNQSQIAVFNPKDITIKSKSLLERFIDYYNQTKICAKKDFLSIKEVRHTIKNDFQYLIKNLKYKITKSSTIKSEVFDLDSELLSEDLQLAVNAAKTH